MNRGLKFSSEYLELTRTQYPPKYIGRIIKFMDIKSGYRILDLGCGTGYFTRYIAKALEKNGEVYGIDNDPALLKIAMDDNRNSKYDISFSEQNAYNTSFDDEFFDMVVLHSFMISTVYPADLINEIGRILKLGGKIVIVESVPSPYIYQPQFTEEFRELEVKATMCYEKGLKKHGYSPFIAYKIPQYLLNQGFKDIKTTGYAVIDLSCIYDTQEKELEKYKSYLENYDTINSSYFYYMLEGGLIEEELEKLKNNTKSWIKSIIKDPQTLDKVGECSISNMIAFKAEKFF